MKTLFKISSLVLLMATISCSSAKQASHLDKIDVNQAFQNVYRATQQALNEADVKDVELESIDLEFATTTTFTKEAGFKLWVLSGSYSKSDATVKSTTFTFKKNDKVTRSLDEEAKIKKFKDYLISAINATKDINDIDQFGLSEFEVEVGFTVTHTADGGIELDIAPVTPTFSGSREKEIAHTITLNFKKNRVATDKLSETLEVANLNSKETPCMECLLKYQKKHIQCYIDAGNSNEKKSACDKALAEDLKTCPCPKGK